MKSEEVKVGVILLCRFSSSRLPGKIFREIAGKPIISHIVERILSVVGREDFIVATSIDPSDDAIADYCTQNGIQVYRGSLSDVALRFLEAGKSMGWDYAVRINGDNLFVATDVMSEMIQLAKTGEYDFLTNTHNKTFPQGMSVEIVRLGFLAEQYGNYSTKEDFEHVTYYLHQNEPGKHLYFDNLKYPEARGLKFAIDEQKDFDLCSRIFSKFEGPQVNYRMPQILEILKNLENE